MGQPFSQHFSQKPYGIAGSDEDAQIVFIPLALLEGLEEGMTRNREAMNAVLNGGLRIPIDVGGARMDFRITLDES